MKALTPVLPVLAPRVTFEMTEANQAARGAAEALKSDALTLNPQSVTGFHK